MEGIGKPKGIVAFDLDGTLLGDNKRISPENAEALKRAKDAGYQLCVVTGRPFSGLLEDILEIGFPYAITSNGARIQTGTGEDLLEPCLLSEERAVRILREVLIRGCTYTYFAGGMGYCDQAMFDRLMARYEGKAHGRYMKRSRVACEDPVEKAEELSRSGVAVENIWIRFHGTEEMDRFLEETGAAADCLVIRTPPIDAEVLAKDADKGTALAKLASYLGVQPSDIFAAGDGISDIPMLAFAGCGAAMANADEAVKAAANYEAPSNNENGFAQALNAWLDSRGET